MKGLLLYIVLKNPQKTMSSFSSKATFLSSGHFQKHVTKSVILVQSFPNMPKSHDQIELESSHIEYVKSRLNDYLF